MNRIDQLEAMAQNVVKDTGCSIQEARAGIRITMIRMAAAFGTITLEDANARLAPVGIKLSRAVAK